MCVILPQAETVVSISTHFPVPTLQIFAERRRTDLSLLSSKDLLKTFCVTDHEDSSAISFRKQCFSYNIQVGFNFHVFCPFTCLFLRALPYDLPRHGLPIFYKETTERAFDIHHSYLTILASPQQRDTLRQYSMYFLCVIITYVEQPFVL